MNVMLGPSSERDATVTLFFFFIMYYKIQTINIYLIIYVSDYAGVNLHHVILQVFVEIMNHAPSCPSPSVCLIPPPSVCSIPWRCDLQTTTAGVIDQQAAGVPVLRQLVAVSVYNRERLYNLNGC
jgi:hypothetical protein